MAKTYRGIKDILKQKILDGSMKPGSRLPSGREIAELYNSSYVTADRALRELAKEGLVIRKRQNGTVVSDWRKNKRGVIAFFITTIGAVSELFDGIESSVRETGFQLVVYQTNNNPEKALACACSAIEDNVDGIIYVPIGRNTMLEKNAQIIRKIQDNGIPLVIAGHCDVEGVSPFSTVSSDHYNAAKEVVFQLINLGHHRIALIGGHLDSNGERIVSGYKNALKESGIEYDPRWIVECDSFPAVSASVRQLMGNYTPPTAFFGMGDQWAACCMSSLKEFGANVPGDVAVVGFGDHPFCQFLCPQLSSVQIRHFEEGQLLTRKLVNMINLQAQKIENIELPCKLIIRESCGSIVAKRT